MHLSAVGLRAELDNNARAAQALTSARNQRAETLYRQELRDQQRAYSVDTIRAQRQVWRRLMHPSMDVTEIDIGDDGAIGLMVLGHPRSVFFYTTDPDDVGDVTTPSGGERHRALLPSDLDPAAPGRVVRAVQRISKQGHDLNIQQLTLAEAPLHSGALVWTLTTGADHPVSYYANASGRRVATDRSRLRR